MNPWSPSGKVDVLHLLEVLDIDNIRREGYREARFSCPYPDHENGDMSASAYMNTETAVWYCHGCKRKGTCITLAASILGISPIKAKRLLRQAYDPSSLNPDERRMSDEVRELWARVKARDRAVENTVISESALESLAVNWPEAWMAWQTPGWNSFDACNYMFERGFEPETLDDWGFGYDERTDRIIFPVRNENGVIIGVKGRAPDDRHPKYLVIGDNPDKDPYYGFPRYFTGSVVFGLDRVITAGHDAIIICEGELDAVALHQMGFTNAVAINGSKLTNRHMMLLKSNAQVAIFFFDFDKAGLEGLWGRDDLDTGEHYAGALETLSRDMYVRLVGSHDADPAEMMRAERHEDVKPLVESAVSYHVAAVSRRVAAA